MVGGENQRMIQLGHCLADITFEILLLQSSLEPGLIVMEFPEDLGAVFSGPWAGSRPASVWQLPQFKQLLAQPGVRTMGIRQSDFGTAYVKPTRILYKLVALEQRGFPGEPAFSAEGAYQGPFPRTTAQVSLVRRPGDTGFKTTGTAAWPASMCQWLASGIVLSMIAVATHNEVERVGEAVIATDSATKVNSRPTPGRWGGRGPPRSTFALGRTFEYRDGVGLISPGRWDPEARSFETGEKWSELRALLREPLLHSMGLAGQAGIQRLCFALACKSDKERISDKTVLAWRQVLHDWLCKHSEEYVKDQTAVIAAGQPFCLKALYHLLKLMGDPDCGVMRSPGGCHGRYSAPAAENTRGLRRAAGMETHLGPAGAAGRQSRKLLQHRVAPGTSRSSVQG